MNELELMVAKTIENIIVRLNEIEKQIVIIENRQIYK